MNKILKIALLTAAVVFCGCKTEKVANGYENINSPRYDSHNSFNDETYVWEQFIYTTNSVQRIK